MRHAPLGIEHNPCAHIDAYRMIDRNTSAPYDLKHLVVRANTCATCCEVITRSLVYLHIEPGEPQHVSSEKPAQRTSNDDCTSLLRHLLSLHALRIHVVYCS